MAIQTSIIAVARIRFLHASGINVGFGQTQRCAAGRGIDGSAPNLPVSRRGRKALRRHPGLASLSRPERNASCLIHPLGLFLRYQPQRAPCALRLVVLRRRLGFDAEPCGWAEAECLRKGDQ